MKGARMEQKPKVKKRKTLRVVIMSLIVLIVILFGGFYIYTLDYYRAEDSAVTAMASADSTIENIDGTLVFNPSPENDLQTALIFYPGGKVAYDAYAPLLIQLSHEGLTCVLIKMPFNLAVFNINAADNIYSLMPGIKNWYIGGHSLGGAMASSYVGKNSDKLSGLILLGAYPVNDSALLTLVVYGSEDINLDLNKLAGVKNIVEIMGGNHAQFGNYGPQKGDGSAAITREAQQTQAVEAMMAFVEEANK